MRKNLPAGTRIEEIVMKARIKWVENACLLGESESGHTVVMDGSPELGGRNLGIRPMELMLIGLGGCTALDVLNILKKSRQDVTDCVIEVDGDRNDEHPKVYSRIHVHFIVTGLNLKDVHVKRAVELSAEKYCSVSAMLGKTATMTHDYEIVAAPLPTVE